jgi:hypothetical protein
MPPGFLGGRSISAAIRIVDRAARLAALYLALSHGGLPIHPRSRFQSRSLRSGPEHAFRRNISEKIDIAALDRRNRR